MDHAATKAPPWPVPDRIPSLNANLVIGNRKKGELMISGYNLLDVNPRTPMPGTVGLGSSMTYIAGTNFNVSYRKEF